MSEGEESSKEAVLNGHRTDFWCCKLKEQLPVASIARGKAGRKAPVSAPKHRTALSFRSTLKWRAGLPPGEKTNECSTTTEEFPLH